MSDNVKLTLAATAIACQDAAIADVPAFAQSASAILGTTHGSAGYSVSYYGEIVKQGLVGANPMLFAEGVPNAASAHLSLMLAVKGACQTIIGTRTAGLDALRLAALRIASGAWDRAIVGAAEEYCDLINQTYAHCGLYAGANRVGPFAGENGFVAGAGAVSLILESRAAFEARGGRARGRVIDAASARGTAGDPARAAEHVLTALGRPGHVLTSANATWIDRAELAAVRRACSDATVSSVYGHVAESFSATPLLGLAATLLAGRLPMLRGGGDLKGVTAATGAELVDAVGVLATDYSGLVTGVRVGLGGD